MQEDFHPIFRAKSKTYQYLVSLKPVIPFFSNLMLEYRKEIKLNVLKKGCDLFKGEHDFRNYFCVGTEVRSTVRTVFSASAKRVTEFDFDGNVIAGDFLLFEFSGSGFLKQQIRLMVGALLNLNEGKVNLEQLEDSLRETNYRHLGPVVASKGLYLKAVEY